MDELVAFVRARLNEREALLLHSRASGIPCPVPIATLLAEVEAKRRILDEYQTWCESSDSNRDPVDSQAEHDIASGLELAIKLLAQPYAGQDGWQEEWPL